VSEASHLSVAYDRDSLIIAFAIGTGLRLNELNCPTSRTSTGRHCRHRRSALDAVRFEGIALNASAVATAHTPLRRRC
jgi:hypothetical protein